MKSKIKALEEEIKELEKTAKRNQAHLIGKLKHNEYLRDKSEKIKAAWKKSDRKRMRELSDLLDQLPISAPARRQKLREESFQIGPSDLNLSACPTPEPPQIVEMAEALNYIARLRMTDDELIASDSRLPSAMFNAE